MLLNGHFLLLMKTILLNTKDSEVNLLGNCDFNYVL